MRGYANGEVSGSSYVGSLVEFDNSTVSTNIISGYVRGTVKRTSQDITFGLLVGFTFTYTSFSVIGYYSNTESQYNSIDKNDATGISETAMYMRKATPSTTQSDFASLDFSTNGPWTWIKDGKWPAINIGIIWASADQPIEPGADSSVNPCSSDVPPKQSEICQLDSAEDMEWLATCVTDASYAGGKLQTYCRYRT